MKKKSTDGVSKSQNPLEKGVGRRAVLTGATAILGAATLSAGKPYAMGSHNPKLRFGIVGTGGIANSFAPIFKASETAELVAVSSRTREKAQAFAKKHDIPMVFDSWQEMIASGSVDAIYAPTPTSVREEICVAAAEAGKHVIGEKPFASLPSLQRIIAACRRHDRAFMDGSHFVHQPRTRHIKDNMSARIGRPLSVRSTIHALINDPSNIRLKPKLEPAGAIGDMGWYSFRAAVEFLPADVVLERSEAHMKRDDKTGAVVSGAGFMHFSDGSTAMWDVGFNTNAVIIDLDIFGEKGAFQVDSFLFDTGRKNGYRFLSSNKTPEYIEVETRKLTAIRMIDHFVSMARKPALREASMHASERTQTLLDAAWHNALGK